ncbi:hypothetical protein R69888_02946 [Paraburkholderia haematera]|uniref:Uncharacterized protein n=1 Tax=Paraburkholderia haematera TaxID=2793077 RepID=A0ABM8RFV9_9BURK|nr:hypothetical protein R69888_02946 [Paraburkholderia haematera]
MLSGANAFCCARCSCFVRAHLARPLACAGYSRIHLGTAESREQDRNGTTLAHSASSPPSYEGSWVAERYSVVGVLVEANARTPCRSPKTVHNAMDRVAHVSDLIGRLHKRPQPSARFAVCDIPAVVAIRAEHFFQDIQLGRRCRNKHDPAAIRLATSPPYRYDLYSRRSRADQRVTRTEGCIERRRCRNWAVAPSGFPWPRASSRPVRSVGDTSVFVVAYPHLGASGNERMVGSLHVVRAGYSGPC